MDAKERLWRVITYVMGWGFVVLNILLLTWTSGLFALPQALSLSGHTQAIPLITKDARNQIVGQCDLVYAFKVDSVVYEGPTVGGMDFPRQCPDLSTMIDIVYDPAAPEINMWAPSYTNWVGVILAALIVVVAIAVVAKRMRKSRPSAPVDYPAQVPVPPFAPIPQEAVLQFVTRLPHLYEEYGDVSFSELIDLMDDSGLGTLSIGESLETTRMFTLSGVLEGEFGCEPQSYDSDPSSISFDLLPRQSMLPADTQTRNDYHQYMSGIRDAFTQTFGQPAAMKDPETDTEIFWWAHPAQSGESSDLHLRLTMGDINELACTFNGSCEHEPQRTTVHNALHPIQLWVHARWPMLPKQCTNLARECGWVADPHSHRRFIQAPLNNARYSVKKPNAQKLAREAHHKSMVNIIGGNPLSALAGQDNPVRGIRFSLVGEFPLATQPEEWPSIHSLCEQVEAELTAEYGSATITMHPQSTGGQGRRAQWTLPSGVTLCLETSPGAAWVTIHDPSSSIDDAHDSRYLFSTQDALLFIDHWLAAERPLSAARATTLLKKAGCVQQYSTNFHTPISVPLGQGARLYKGEDNIDVICLDMAADTHRGPHALSAQRIMRTMTDIEAALTERYGPPECLEAYSGHYRMWTTPGGQLIRIAYGLGMSMVWICEAEKRPQIEDLVITPSPVRPESFNPQDVMLGDRLPWEIRAGQDPYDIMLSSFWQVYAWATLVVGVVGTAIGMGIVRFFAV